MKTEKEDVEVGSCSSVVKAWQLKPGALSFIPNNCQHFTFIHPHNITPLFTNLSIIEDKQGGKKLSVKCHPWLIHTMTAVHTGITFKTASVMEAGLVTVTGTLLGLDL